MKTTEKTSKQTINEKVLEIIELYKDSTISEMLNDMDAIGTWPTPEKKYKQENKDDLVKNTVPVPEKPKELKRLLGELVKGVGDRKIGEVWIK